MLAAGGGGDAIYQEDARDLAEWRAMPPMIPIGDKVITALIPTLDEWLRNVSDNDRGQSSFAQMTIFGA